MAIIFGSIFGISNFELMAPLLNPFFEDYFINYAPKPKVDICCLFARCSSLKHLPDISCWNAKNIANIYGLFAGCSSLKTLPDISKWNTDNIRIIEALFYGCSSLKYLPDISKWNTSKVSNISMLFCD